MYALSLGVQSIKTGLPDPVYALLSGLNAATVGIVLLAAVQLSQKAITDKLTRLLVFFGGAAGMLYTALWYFPVLMVAGGLATLLWDLRIPHQLATPLAQKFTRRRRQRNIDEPSQDIELNPAAATEPPAQPERSEPRVIPPSSTLPMRLPTGLLLLTAFLLAFTALMITRGVLHPLPLTYSLFANLYLAGTIIFGGGPVVIPLLREYIVSQGWVSPRDFLLGLAIIQAFPGPNFNFAIYLGALTVANQTSLPSILGAIIGYVAIFLPGVWVQTAFLGVWRVLRGKLWFRYLLRGLHATAVGLVYTAVYRLWQIGLLDRESQSGRPLGDDAWWVAVTATSFVGGRWFGVSAPAAILLGGVMGVVWYGVVRA